MSCPCGLGLSYDECCGPAHAGTPPTTAEALMRSRYSAFVLLLPDYLLDSWHPSTRPASLDLDPDTRWTGLRVLSARGGLFDTEGEVLFRATWAGGAMRERSRFLRDDGRWSYLGAV